MNISKALKVKNRIIGQNARLEEIFRRENSIRDDNPTKVDSREILTILKEGWEDLIELKAAISLASAPISEKLARIAELKNQINYYKSLPCREGEEVNLIGSNREKLVYQWKCVLNKAEIDKQVEILQGEINDCQDEIDDFNAKTKVDFEE